MGLFSKKRDPISEKAKLLNNQISALESEIKRLGRKKEQLPAESKPAPASPFLAPPQRQAQAQPKPHYQPQPRLRSTAVPHQQAQAAPAAVPEPIFEEVDQERIQSNQEPTSTAHYNELGVRKYDLASAWRRMKNQFRGPVASNPKLVQYLSAGSIQGLRPLRYEKRVARNRFLVLAGVLLLALWGILYIFWSKK